MLKHPMGSQHITAVATNWFALIQMLLCKMCKRIPFVVDSKLQKLAIDILSIL